MNVAVVLVSEDRETLQGETLSIVFDTKSDAIFEGFKDDKK